MATHFELVINVPVIAGAMKAQGMTIQGLALQTRLSYNATHAFVLGRSLRYDLKVAGTILNALGLQPGDVFALAPKAPAKSNRGEETPSTTNQGLSADCQSHEEIMTGTKKKTQAPQLTLVREPEIMFVIAVNRNGDGWHAIHLDPAGKHLDRTVYFYEGIGPKDADTLWQMLAARFSEEFLSATSPEDFFWWLPPIEAPRWDCDCYQIKKSVSAFRELCLLSGGLQPEMIAKTRQDEIMASLKAVIEAKQPAQAKTRSRTRRQARATA